MNGKGKITCREAGRRGGKSTLKKHGPEFFQVIGKKGGKTSSSKRKQSVNTGAKKPTKGKMTVGEAGHIGGQTTAKRYGPKFYEEIGHKGGRKVKNWIDIGKRAAKREGFDPDTDHLSSGESGGEGPFLEGP